MNGKCAPHHVKQEAVVPLLYPIGQPEMEVPKKKTALPVPEIERNGKLKDWTEDGTMFNLDLSNDSKWSGFLDFENGDSFFDPL
jgi:hypothetical protein